MPLGNAWGRAYSFELLSQSWSYMCTSLDDPSLLCAQRINAKFIEPFDVRGHRHCTVDYVRRTQKSFGVEQRMCILGLKD